MTGEHHAPAINLGGDLFHERNRGMPSKTAPAQLPAGSKALSEYKSIQGLKTLFTNPSEWSNIGRQVVVGYSNTYFKTGSIAPLTHIIALCGMIGFGFKIIDYKRKTSFAQKAIAERDGKTGHHGHH
eukprot:TRINITY_DN70_c0_g1_i4.p1 TRINITY_DN70_c0_g1~~TRINITY_DN70_c0_g1_i4.p1  ORF type:complete len:127 (-),score=62.31 TRINITY_DN70_c0_g1_i4:171-551(-)